MAAIDFKLTDNTAEILKATEHQIAAALVQLGETAEGYAKQNITDNENVDTGRLRNSIAHIVDVGGKCVRVGTNVFYGPYIEFGTGKFAEDGGRQTPWIYTDRHGQTHRTVGYEPHPYLRPAISEHIDEYKEIVKKKLQS